MLTKIKTIQQDSAWTIVRFKADHPMIRPKVWGLIEPPEIQVTLILTISTIISAIGKVFVETEV